MNKTKYIITSCMLSLLASGPVLAQPGEERLQDSIHVIELNPSSISVTGKLYALPHVSVMESGNIGASPVLMLRGVNSINLSSSPLMYIDGIPLRYNSSNPTFLSTYEPDRLGFLNPYDIAEIGTHASGRALCKVGGRGRNGACDIQTERGQLGGSKANASAQYGTTV